MDYLLHLLVLLGIYVILAYSLDLLAGHAGILSLAQAAFFGLGAYSSALLTVRGGAHPALALVAGMAAAALASLAVSLPSFRLREDYFVLATFGFQMIVLNTFNNWQDVTGGALGIPGIPEFALPGYLFRTRVEFAALVFLAALGTVVAVSRVASSPFGRVLHAIREDEVFVQAVGKDPLAFKVSAFAFSASLAAAAGSLYAHYMAFIDPSSFSVMESILVLSMVIVGGAGSRWGPLFGAAGLLLIPEALRFLGMPATVAAHLRQVLYGSLLVAVLLVRPRGLAGEPLGR